MWFPRKRDQGTFGQGHAVRYRCPIGTAREWRRSREWYLSAILTASNLTSFYRVLEGAPRRHVRIRLLPDTLMIPFACLITL